jgi:urease accessory protein
VLLLVADGRFPSGAHAHSAGTESAVAHGDVVDVDSLERFLAGRLSTTGTVDASFAACACAVDRDDHDGLVDLDREYDARVLAPRSRAVSRQHGRQLVRVARSLWPHSLGSFGGAPPGPHHSIALGRVVAAAGGTPLDAATIALHQLAAAVTTAAVRLLGLDPVALAAVHARAAPAMAVAAHGAAERATTSPRLLPATGSTLAEILAEEHATWTHRLFVA